MFTDPISFQEADEAFAARLDRPSALRHSEIAARWDASLRARSFFSARVAEATVLSQLRDKVEAVLSGRMSTSQARDLLTDYFVGEGADPLAAMGFAPPRDARGVSELASVPRLNLILETNVRMAQECGQYRQWAEVKDYYGYGRWVCGFAEEHRPEHLRRDGRVYPFDHPIWTQSPPGGEFNCHCSRELLSAEVVEDEGLTPEPLDSDFQPSSLGFDPSRPLDYPPEFGQRVRPEFKEAAEHLIENYRSQMVQPAAGEPSHPSTPVSNVSQSASVTQEAGTTRHDHLFEGEVTIDSRLDANLQDSARTGLKIVRNALGVPNLDYDIHVEELPEGLRRNESGNIRLGNCSDPDYSGKRPLYTLRINPEAPCPILTTVHETLHSLLAENTFGKRQLDTVFELIKCTRTYELGNPKINEWYKDADKRKEEWIVRAVAWHWLSESKLNAAQKEEFAILNNEMYIKDRWAKLNKKTMRKEDKMSDRALAKEIDRLTESFAKKIMRLFGFFTDEEDLSKYKLPPDFDDEGLGITDDCWEILQNLKYGTPEVLKEYLKETGQTYPEYRAKVENTFRIANDPEECDKIPLILW